MPSGLCFQEPSLIQALPKKQQLPLQQRRQWQCPGYFPGELVQ
jgi:hypothetical protein